MRYIGLVVAALLGAANLMVPGDGGGAAAGSPPVARIVLLSVDGLHAIDLAHFVQAHPDSALARLASHGTTYTEAATSRPSDSFPGILALVTGGGPATTGVFYDVSYDRTLSPPKSNCATTGTEVAYDSSIDRNPDAVDAGGGIDPAKLPLQRTAGGCAPVYPHNYLRVNTVFEVVKAAGGYTAWADKHPSYEILEGPSGSGVDDLFTPEIDADDITSDVGKTEANDDLKVEALVHEINGMDHAGTRRTAVPRLLGMNFQAVSVAQKLPAHGYADAAGTPSAGLGAALNYTDRSIGRLMAALSGKGLLNTTMIIVTAKHGQSPIDRRRLLRLDPKRSPNIAGVINALEPGLVVHETRDDISLVWLKDSARAAAAVRAIRNQREGLAVEEIYSGGFLSVEFGDPLRDPRVPDVIVQPRAGVIYTGSSGKIAEHGGFADDDVHVALLVSAPGMAAAEVAFPVRTAQVAPTILKMLGLDPAALKAVQV